MKRFLSYVPLLLLGILTLVFPFLLVLILPIAVLMFVVYGLVSGFRTRNRTFRISLAIVLVIASSHLYHRVSRPCGNGVRFCDYYYGFPIPFFVFSDYFSLPLMLVGLIGFAIDVALWYAAISFILRRLKHG